MSQDTVLYEEFLEARREAIDLTDAFHNVHAGDPRRKALWEGVVRQTELARRLLETWLRVSAAPQCPPETPIWVSAGQMRLRLRALDREAGPEADAERAERVTTTSH